MKLSDCGIGTIVQDLKLQRPIMRVDGPALVYEERRCWVVMLAGANKGYITHWPATTEVQEIGLGNVVMRHKEEEEAMNQLDSRFKSVLKRDSDDEPEGVDGD